jgi:uncharacterized repeat protein (TIGR01451 family)/fimbrial isopeptide formation D2 family protein
MLSRAREWSGSVVAGPNRTLRVALAGAAALATLVAGGSALADPASPITVTKTASSSPVASGAEETYTIVVKNTAGGTISNVVLTDQVNGLGVIQTPPALPQLIITTTKGSCTQGGANGNLVSCSAGTMAGGESFTVTIRGQVTAGAGTTLNNTASVTGTKSAQNFTTQSNPVAVPVTPGAGGASDLTINKTGPTSVAPSTAMTYTLTVNNIGTANATGVKVIDTLPAGVTFVSTTQTSLFTCANLLGTVTCTGGAVNAGQNGTIGINVLSPPTAASLTNTAVVDPDNTISETNELNNTSAAVFTQVGSTPPPAPKLSIQKVDAETCGAAWCTGAGPDPVTPGTKLTYKIQVTNLTTGQNSVANDVVMTDNTQGLDAASITASQSIIGGQAAKTDKCTVAAPQVKCTLKALNSLGTITITITGTVQQSAGSSIFNTATATGNIKNTGVSDTASAVTTVRPQVDLTITKDDTPDPVCARSWPTTIPNQHLPSSPAVPLANGTPTALLDTAVCLGGLTYPLVIGNSGIGTAANVDLRDALPPGLIFDSYQNTDGGGFTCGLLPGNVVSCTGGTIPAASVRHLNLLFTAPPTTGSISNTVVVDPNNAIFEPDETNNSATQATTVNTGVDLAVWKNDAKGDDPPGAGAPILDEGFDPIATNGTGTYTVIVDNVGPQDTTGIKVVDTLPAGTRFLSVTSDDNSGFTCSHNGAATGGDVTCVGGHLIGTEAEFYHPAGTSGLLPGDQFATIKIKFFATKFVQPKMHNVVRVDPDNTIPEVNELNNTKTDDTVVTNGNDDKGAFNQLAIVKTQKSPAGPVATNGTLTYDLRVDNYGTDPVSNVAVKDFLPTGSRFISAADTTGLGPLSAAFFCIHDGSATGGVITCTGGDFDGTSLVLPGGYTTTRHITVTVFAPATPGTATNHATVDPDDVVPEGNEFDNDSSVTTPVAPCVGGGECTNENAFYELTMEKTQVSPDRLNTARNGIITYNLKVSNLGSDSVHSVVATDRLPAGFRFIDAKDSAGPGDPNAFTCAGPDGSGVVTCSGGSLSGTVNVLAGGAPTFRTIVVRVFAPDEPGTYSNLAFVDPNNTIPEGNEFNNQASLDTTVKNGGAGPYVDLAVVKTRTIPDPATDASVAPGGGIQYQLHVTNGGAADAFNVAVRDALPQHVTFHNARDAVPTSAGAFTCAVNSGVLDCTGGTITAGGSRDILVNVIVDSTIDGAAQDPADVHILITNQAIVDPNNTIPEGDETNNTSSVDTTIKPPFDLTLEKDGPGSASPNENTTYTITVHNVTKVGAGATATGVKIVDPLPTGLIPLNVEADPGNFRCDLQEDTVNKVTCFGDLPAGTDVKITITAFVTLQSGTLDNEACVDPDDTIAETDETNNCKHAIGSVETPKPDLQIQKTADKTSVTAGDTLTYTLSASNVGTGGTTASLSMSDQVPDELTVTNVNPDVGWDCDTLSSGNNVTCTMDSLAAGASAQIVVTTTVNGSLPLTVPFTNTANIIGGGEDNAANNTSSVTTALGTAKPVDLKVVSVTDSPDPVNHDNSLTYTAVVVNTGTSGTGPGAIVRVALPTGGVPVGSMAVTANNSFTCAATVSDPKVFDCTGNFGASGSPTASTTITATMTVDSLAPPPTELSATVTADPDGAIDESDETNNAKTEKTTVSGTVCGGSPCVDLLALATGPPTIQTGGLGVFNATVMNVGTSPVPSSTVWSIQFEFLGGLVTSVVPTVPGVSCSGFAIITCTSSSGSDPMDLAPGASLTFIVTAQDLLPAGAGVTLQVTADSSGAVTELTTANNVGIAIAVTSP